MVTELKPLTEPAEKSDLVVYEGITTSVGVGGNTVVDSGLTQANNYWNNMVVRIKSGSSNDQVRRISGFVQATGTITVDTAFSTQIAIGTQYDILGQYAGPGGGGDATAANQVLILADTNAILIDTAEIGAAGAGLTAVAQASVCLEARLAELDAANLPTDIDIIKADTPYLVDSAVPVGPTDGSLASFIATGGTALGTRLPASRSLYDFLLTTDNNYSTTASLGFTTEKTVIEIAVDTRYQVLSPWIDITPFTVGATITFQFYRSVAAAGATYRKGGDSITKVVGTDNPVVEFADWAHYGYTKVTAISNNAGDTAVTVPFGYIKKPLE